MIDFLTLLQVLRSLRLATPLLLVCLAGLFSERAGIFDIGLEGKLLAAASHPLRLPYSRISLDGPIGRHIRINPIVTSSWLSLKTLRDKLFLGLL